MNSKNIQLFSRINNIDVMMFTKHLAVMLKSGVAIGEAIDLLANQTVNNKWRQVLIGIGSAVKNGQTMETALGKYPKVFSPLYRHVVQVGELSGTLETNLSFLEKELTKNYEFRRRVKGAMLYPGLIVLTAIVVGGGIVLFVLPQMVDLFKSMDVTLPLSTRILIFIGDYSKQYGVLTAVGLASIIFLLNLTVKTKKVKPIWHNLKLKFPIWGKMLQEMSMAGFCRNLGLMLSAGVPIEEAMRMTAESCENEVYKKYAYELLGSVGKGKSLEKELGNGRFRYIPPIAIKMIGVGERSGKLPETFMYLGDFWEGEVDERAKSLMTVLEPLLLLGVAVGVAFLAMAIISPIYQFTASVK